KYSNKDNKVIGYVTSAEVDINDVKKATFEISDENLDEYTMNKGNIMKSDNQRENEFVDIRCIEFKVHVVLEDNETEFDDNRSEAADGRLWKNELCIKAGMWSTPNIYGNKDYKKDIGWSKWDVAYCDKKLISSAFGNHFEMRKLSRID
ncbi:12831_t:CDS:2, partial [Dentiscutata heterogama]